MNKLPKIQLSPTRLVLLLLAFVLLFLGFYRNQWQVVRQKKFSLFQKDVEAYVIARLVLTRQSGILSQGGLLGWGDVDPEDINEDDYQYQYDTYLQGGAFQTYLEKMSHPGFQGIFFSALDRLSPLSSSDNLRLFRIITAGVFALVITGLIFWFSLEFGWLPALFVLASILTSQWMTLFGRNLFFVSGLFYFPMLLLLFRLHGERIDDPILPGTLFQLVFSTILVKCLFNGYDFILPTLGMAASPLIFYSIRDKWGRGHFTRRFLLVVLASLTAILASLLVLSIQVMVASGSFMQGVDYILETVNRRTLSNDPTLPSVYAEAKNASTWSILKIYLSETYFFDVHVPYYVIMIVFAVVSIAQLVIEKIRSSTIIWASSGPALIAVTWFSLLGPLSWYVIFKSVAYFHTHMNYLPWHMPFTLFGFGLCGVFIRSVFGLFTNTPRKMT
jgi:hypothetical protein